MYKRIAIIGLGFSGLMVFANMVKQNLDYEIHLIDPNSKKHSPHGVAYSTDNPMHLLNVRAGNMSAFADEPNHFIDWLNANIGPTLPNAFVPRMIYGKYLDDIFKEALKIAEHKNMKVHLHNSKAIAVSWNDGFDISTEGDNITADTLVLATGNAPPKLLPATNSTSIQMVQDLWSLGTPEILEIINNAAESGKPIAIIGTGLTAMDAVLSLRSNGYNGKIIAISRNGLLPQSHQITPKAYMDWVSNNDKIKSLPLSKKLCLLRQEVKKAIALGYTWQDVIDSLRPHTIGLWSSLPIIEKKHFLRRLFSFWNTHRHRMAPEIAQKIEAEISAGTLQIMQGRVLKINGTNIELQNKRSLESSSIINCCGPDYSISATTNLILKSMLDSKLITPHAAGTGAVVSEGNNLANNQNAPILTVGTLLTGEYLETTAVPELRVQAANISKKL